MGTSDVQLDHLIAQYSRLRQAGESAGPEQFIAAYPQHRAAFIRAVTSGEVAAAASVSRSVETTSCVTEASQSDGAEFELINAGTAIGGRYTTLHPLGHGGMGMVYLAERQPEGRRVALKLLRGAFRGDSQSIERMKRESRAVASLEHPHVVPLVEAELQRDPPFLVMQLIDGFGLDQLIDLRRTRLPRRPGSPQPPLPTQRSEGVRRSPLSQCPATECLERLEAGDYFRNVALLAADIADALQTAHERGIVHRDVKPSNILLDVETKAWLTDFGLATLGSEATALTASGDVLGTPAYMSPEQADAGGQSAVDHRTDIYSLGVTLYELVTLWRPYRGHRLAVMRDVLRGRYAPPSKVNAEVPRQLEAIICHAMSLRPRDRYATAGDMARDLRSFARGDAVGARRPGVIPRTLRWCERNPALSLSLAVGLILAIVIAFAVQAWHSHSINAMNEALVRSNQQLGEAITNLAKSNRALDASRLRLRMELYVNQMADAFDAYQENNIPAARELLSRYQDPSGSEDPRGTPWRLLDALTRPATTRLLGQHEGAATELAVSADRRTVVSVGHDGDVQTFSLATGRPIRQYFVGGKLDALALSGDAPDFLVGSNVPMGLNYVHFQSAAGGSRELQAFSHWSSIESLAVSPSGQWIAAGDRYDKVLVCDREGKRRGVWKNGDRNASLEWLNDDKIAAIARPKRKLRLLYVWDVDKDAAELVDLPFQVDSFRFGTHSAGGQSAFLVAAGHHDLCMMDWSSQKVLLSARHLPGRIRCVDISSDGRTILAGCDEGVVLCWFLDALPTEPSSLPRPRVIQVSQQRITDIALLSEQEPEGQDGTAEPRIRFLSTSEDGCVRLAEVPAHDSRRWELAEQFGGGQWTDVIVAPDNHQRLLLMLTDGRLLELDLTSMRAREHARLAVKDPTKALMSPDGEQIYWATSEGILVIDVASGQQRGRLPLVQSDQACTGLAMLRGELVALFNNHLTAYDLQRERMRHSMRLPSDDAQQLLPVPGRDALICLCQHGLYYFSNDQLTQLRKPASAAEEFRHAALSVDGTKLALASKDNSIRVLRLEGEPESELRLTLTVPRMSGHQNEVTSLRFLDEGRILASGSSDQTLRFWDLNTGRILGVLSTPDLAAAHLDALEGDRWLLGGDPTGRVQIWPTQPALQQGNVW